LLVVGLLCPSADDATNATMEIATGARRGARLEFQGRADCEGAKDRYASAFTEVALPKSAGATKNIGSIKSLAGLGQDRFNSAVVGPIRSLGWPRLGSRCDGQAEACPAVGGRPPRRRA
jgi:hypothetical protein